MAVDTEYLKKLWDGKSEYVQSGSLTFRVATPNGKENPVFIPQQDTEMYSSLSHQAPDPKPAASKPTRKPKTTDTTKKAPAKKASIPKKHTDLGG